MTTLRADILSRVQHAPGRWTVNELADATGRSQQAVTNEIVALFEQGHIEKPSPIDYFDSAEGWRTVTFTPTPKGWVRP